MTKERPTKLLPTRAQIAKKLEDLRPGKTDKKEGMRNWLESNKVVEDDIVKILDDLDSYQ